MYLEHFGLKEFPFSISPDTDFFLSTSSAREALNTLLVAVKTGEGFIKITGEVGTGKSLLCRQLLMSLPPEYTVAYLPNPFLDTDTLFVQIATDIGAIEPSQNLSKAQVLRALNDRLLGLHRNNQRVLVCLDEAQAMPIETLEALRLLSNLETEKRKLLQVIIFGQPELEEKLSHPSIRQLKQRIVFDYCLQPMRPDEVGVYLRHRLAVAGRRAKTFTPAAIAMLRWYSKGVPRLVNIIAHKALLSAFGKGRQVVRMSDVKAAVTDTTSIDRSKLGAFVLLGLAAVIAAVALYQAVAA